MGVPFEQTPVHVGAGVALVGVDDHVLRLAGGVARFLPLPAGGKASAASAPELRLLDLLHHSFGGHLEEGLLQGSIAPDSQVVVDALRVDAPVRTEHPSHLMPIEGDVRFLLYALVGAGVRIEQPIDGGMSVDGLRDDLAGVTWFHLQVAGFVRMGHDHGASFAEPATAGLSQLHLVTEALGLQFGLHAGRDFPAARGETGRPATERDVGLRRVPLRPERLPVLLQFDGRTYPRHDLLRIWILAVTRHRFPTRRRSCPASSCRGACRRSPLPDPRRNSRGSSRSPS